MTPVAISEDGIGEAPSGLLEVCNESHLFGMNLVAISDDDIGEMDGWMSYGFTTSISVILRRWKGEHERLCAMKCRLGSGRISPSAGFEPATS